MSLQSIVKKERGLNRLNDWRNPAYVTREKSVVFTRSTKDTFIEDYEVKTIFFFKNGIVQNKINNMHLEYRVHFYFTLTLQLLHFHI